MKINHEHWEFRTWLKTIAWMAVNLLGLGCAVNNAYKCGQYTKCRQLDDRGYDPVEIFSDD